MTSPWIFISACTGGMGRALTRHLLRTTSAPILATARPHHDAAAIKDSLLRGLPSSDDETLPLAARLHIVHADVTDEATLERAAAKARDLFPPSTHHLRLACALAGILHPEKNLRQVDAASSLESFQVNAVGTLLLMKHFAPFLPRRPVAAVAVPTTTTTTTNNHSAGKVEQQERQWQLPAPHAAWVSVAARVGSTSDNRLGGWFSYRASKAAVISLARTLDLHLRARSGDAALSVAYHPGTVRTELSREFWGGVPEGKLFTPEYAAERMVDVVARLEVAQRGRCWDWKGDEILP